MHNIPRSDSAGNKHRKEQGEMVTTADSALEKVPQGVSDSTKTKKTLKFKIFARMKRRLGFLRRKESKGGRRIVDNGEKQNREMDNKGNKAGDDLDEASELEKEQKERADQEASESAPIFSLSDEGLDDCGDSQEVRGDQEAPKGTSDISLFDEGIDDCGDGFSNDAGRMDGIYSTVINVLGMESFDDYAYKAVIKTLHFRTEGTAAMVEGPAGVMGDIDDKKEASAEISRLSVMKVKEAAAWLQKLDDLTHEQNEANKLIKTVVKGVVNDRRIIGPNNTEKPMKKSLSKILGGRYNYYKPRPQ